MDLDQEHLPTGPVGHIGISLALALVLRLNPVVTVFCALLPDIVDKPLAAMDIGGGRYVAHSLLFVGLVSAAFALWKWKFGLASPGWRDIVSVAGYGWPGAVALSI